MYTLYIIMYLRYMFIVDLVGVVKNDNDCSMMATKFDVETVTEIETEQGEYYLYGYNIGYDFVLKQPLLTCHRSQLQLQFLQY